MRSLSDELLNLLARWERRELTTREVHEEAEVLFDRGTSEENGRMDNEYTAAMEALTLLDVLPSSWVTVEDVPAIAKFIRDSMNGSPEPAWNEWRKYWDLMDYEVRRTKVEGDSYYSTVRV